MCGLRAPVTFQAGRNDQQARTLQYAAGPLIKQVRQYLYRLAQAHVISQDAAGAELEYLALMANCYEDDYVLEIGGYVERPMTLTIAELRELAAGHSQTTLHHCVQGFTSIGRWRGIPVSDLMDLVKPLPGATDVVYTSFQNMGRDDVLYEGGGTYYEPTPMVEARMPQTLIAFELNDEGEIPAKNGARCGCAWKRRPGFAA